MAAKLLLLFAICRLIVIDGLTLNPTDLFRVGIDGKLSIHPHDITAASMDFGRMTRTEPAAVLHPVTADDVAKLVRLAYQSSQGFAVSARGHGHSINGQSQAANGVVVQMSGGRRDAAAPEVNEKSMYVDVWGGELWIDVLK